MKLPCALFFLVVLIGGAAVAGQTFTEFPIPATRGVPHPPRITAGPDGNLWFTVQTDIAHPFIGRLTPEGAITMFGLPILRGPLGITTGPDGNVWFIESLDGTPGIGRITTSGVITEYWIPTQNSEADGIAAGPDGALWFTEHSGNKIGRITTSGAITEFVSPGSGAGPEGIAAGPDGALWFTEAGANRIGRITTSGEITEFPIPTPASVPISIAAGPDGALWFTETGANQIGRITTSGEISEFPIPTPASQPFGIAAGLDGNLYFAESAGNKIGRITTSGAVTEYPVPTPGSVPQGIAWGLDGAIWFTEYGAGKIGRLSIGAVSVDRPAPVPPSPRERRTRVRAPRDSPTASPIADADLYLAPTTPPCTEVTEVTGIYQDGKGTYLPGDAVVWADTTNGIDLRIKPLCSADRQLDALLPAAAIALLTGPMNPCQDSGDFNTIQLKIPDLQGAPTGVVGQPSLPPDYFKADSVYFYFLVDSNHDGIFGPGDDGYNLVWQSGIYLTRTELPDRTVYELTTELTSSDAELFRGIGTGGVIEGVFCVPLRLTATRWK